MVGGGENVLSVYRAATAGNPNGTTENFKIENGPGAAGAFHMEVNKMYNGFIVNRFDGVKIYYTIQKRTFNRRPYALYVNGVQSAWCNTYVNRGSLVNAVEKLKAQIKANCHCTISDIYGSEIIRT